MDDVGIEYQTVLGYPPVEFVHLAADLGCHAISMKARTGPYNAANPYGYGDFSFLDDGARDGRWPPRCVNARWRSRWPRDSS